MNTIQKGEITELAICAHLISKGFGVSRPIGNNLRYDLIADYKGKLIKIQVKTSRKGKQCNSITFKTVSSHVSTKGKSVRRRYNKNEIDYFATAYNGEAYFIPVEDAGSSEFSLRLAPSKNKQIKGIHFLEDYTIKHFLKRIKDD